ncbi:MAG TPA: GMC family oxidoreductase [Acidimicrobiales bacterium]|nr:GMC family oxidoreductase [Acidimicrobiales bacterium]
MSAGVNPSRDFDAVVIGSGPGGSAAALALIEAGWSVLLVEKGRNHLIDADDPSRLLGDYSNDEIKFVSRHFLGPDPFLEPRTFRTSEAEGDRAYVGEVNSIPTTVGGGGVHADGKTPRFLEEDFRLLSERGPIDGATLADWPFGYEEMEPYYAEAERLIGVAGEAGSNPFAAPRSGPFPMPPGAPMYVATLTTAAAERIGLHPYPAPTAANSVPYDGRPACNNCGFCAFFGCPIHAKGDPVAMLQRALASGRCRLEAETFASRILVRNGRATGVELIGPDGAARTESARAVVVAAGAFETPRLLLLSGFQSDWIGRNVMFHFQTFVVGATPRPIHGHRGRAVTHLHDDHLIADPASQRAAKEAGLPWIRGGMVEHGAAGHPILEAKIHSWGPGHKDAMRDSSMRARMVALTMQGEDLPQAGNRVDLDPLIRDVRGVPVARTTYQPHRHELAASAHYSKQLVELLEVTGVDWTMVATSPWPGMPYSGGAISPIPASRHVMGTVRMADGPSGGSCDQWGRMFEAPNVLIADSSPFPTGSGYGPTLTLVALALRNARALASAGA